MSGLLLLRRRLPRGSLLARPFQTRNYGILGKPQTTELQLHALPSAPARTRFAPSPTGYLHLGSLRTALYNYLLARATGGQFVIRLEDTDRTRFVADAEEKLYEDLKWARMDWDEGPDKGGKFGPYKQSERLGLYKEHAEILLNNGRAFRCFCSNKPLRATLEPEMGWENTGYPGTCKQIPKAESDRRAANGEPHTIRFHSSRGAIEYMDIVYGLRRVKHTEDDPIIMKTDGFPTYHFANVVDDHHMEITHVIRGAEWLISTPLHIDMYQALAWEPPNFGHVGLLVDQQRQKLSKRDRDNIGVSVFRDNHILPYALMNFAILLGWNPQLQKNPHLQKNGLMTMEEMQDNFTLKFTRGDIVVDLSKLKYFQGLWVRGLASGTIKKLSILAEFLVGPIFSVVKSVDDILSRFDKFEANRRRRQKPLELSPAEKLTLDNLGISIDDHFGFSAQYPKSSLKRHIELVLRAAKDIVNSPEQFVRDHKFAIFPPKAKALFDTSTSLYKNSETQIIRWGESKRSAKEVKIHFVMNVFHNQMRELRDKKGVWTEEDVNMKLNTIVNYISVYDRVRKEYDGTAPWRYLKWAFLCAEPESTKISIVRLILAWGPDHTFRMIRRAFKVAERVQKGYDKAFRREDTLKKRAVKEIRMSFAKQRARKEQRERERPKVRRVGAKELPGTNDGPSMLTTRTDEEQAAMMQERDRRGPLFIEPQQPPAVAAVVAAAKSKEEEWQKLKHLKWVRRLGRQWLDAANGDRLEAAKLFKAWNTITNSTPRPFEVNYVPKPSNTTAAEAAEAAAEPAAEDAQEGPKWFEPKREADPVGLPETPSVASAPATLHQSLTPEEQQRAREPLEARKRVAIRNQTAAKGPFFVPGTERRSRLLREPPSEPTAVGESEPSESHDRAAYPSGAGTSAIKRLGSQETIYSPPEEVEEPREADTSVGRVGTTPEGTADTEQEKKGAYSGSKTENTHLSI